MPVSFFLFQDVLPLRVKGIVFYNAPPLIEKTMNNVVKPFLKKKIADRVSKIINIYL